MGVINNLGRETELLPAITREQLSVMQSFKPQLVIIDITNPIPGLWEFYCDRSNFGGYAYVWLSIDGRMVGTAYEEMRPVPLAGGGRDKQRWGVGVKRIDWTNRYSFSREMETIESEWGIKSLGENIYSQMQDWCVDQVNNRTWGEGCDYYGRTWKAMPEGYRRCPVCGQPEDIEEPCDHKRMSQGLVKALKGQDKLNEPSEYQKAIESEHNR